MLMCGRCSRTKETSQVLLRSNRMIELPTSSRETISVPSFIGARQLCTLDSSPGARGGASVDNSVKGGHHHRLLHHRPACLVLQSESHTPWRHSVITSELFTNLFGAEYEHCKAPVLLIAGENGNIYFTNFARDGPGGRSECQDMLTPLHGLEQPITSIHSAYFPVRKDSSEFNPFLIQDEQEWRASYQEMSKTHNALLFLGLRGRVTVCYAAATDSQQHPGLGFVDYHVPGPILSSVLVQDRCLLYSTSQGLYRICLRTKCAESAEEKASSMHSKLPIKIPEVSFKFPERVFDSDHAYYLFPCFPGGSPEPGVLEQGGSDVEGDRECCLCVSLDGRLSTFSFSPCTTEIPDSIVTRMGSSRVGREIKQCLETIQAQGRRTDEVMEEIRSLNAVLTELRDALDILCGIGETSLGREAGPAPWGTGRNLFNRSECTPAFSCTFQCTCEDVGVCTEQLSVVVELTRSTNSLSGSSAHSKGKLLGKGWSLLATLMSGESAISKSVSITELACGDSVRLVLDASRESAGEEGQVGGAVNCFVRFNPAHLCEGQGVQRGRGGRSSCSGVSLLLGRREFDILDYLRPHKRVTARRTLSSLQAGAIKSILAPSGVRGDVVKHSTPPTLHHITTLTIALQTAVALIQCFSTLSTAAIQESSISALSTEFLRYLLPKVLLKPSTAPRGEIFTGLDGESVSFKLSCTEGESNNSRLSECAPDTVLKLDVRASSERFLARIVSAVNGRLLRAPPSEGGANVSHTKACEGLAKLRRLLGEVAEIRREMSSGKWSERRVGHDGSEAYLRTLNSWRARTVGVYCKLRELSSC